MSTTLLQTPDYMSLLQMKQWKEKRVDILSRDCYKCRNCGSRQRLQVHHRQYHVNGKTGMKKQPWQYDNKYLITLCRECHETGHKFFQVNTYNV
jgi:5-methylcytosine-specific restriction endonuclease McrA